MLNDAVDTVLSGVTQSIITSIKVIRSLLLGCICRACEMVFGDCEQEFRSDA